MQFDKDALLKQVVVKITKAIYDKYSIILDYDTVVNVALSQFEYIKFAMDNNVDKINVISIGTFKRNFIRERSKQIRESFEADGLSKEDARAMANKYISNMLKDLPEQRNVRINNRATVKKTIELPLDI